MLLRIRLPIRFALIPVIAAGSPFVVHEQGIRAGVDSGLDQGLAGGDAADDMFNHGVGLHLQTVRAIIAEIVDFQVLVAEFAELL